LSEQIRRLEHDGLVDTVSIAVADLDRRRLLATTAAGEQLAVALPRHQKLFDGAVLVLEEDRAIIVRAAMQRWLRLEPRSIGDAIELGYHAGNLHWRVRFDGEVLLVALEAQPKDYISRIDNLMSSDRVAASVIDGDAADAFDDGRNGHHHHHSHGH
jgi:urease accessory protein